MTSTLDTDDFRSLASNASRFLDTCDGGDIGSRGAPSTWLMGVEPGNSLEDQRKEREGVKSPSEMEDRKSVV